MADSVRASEDSPCCFRPLRSGGIRVIWELISKCNLDCIHCFVDHTENGISTAEARGVIAEFADVPVTKVMFTGGEPFLRKDLLDLVEMAIDTGAIVDITSNLTFLTDARIERLHRIGLHEMTTSLDGPEPVHDYIRKRRGNFRHVTATIQRLREAGIDVDLVCVAQQANADHIEETIDIAEALGVSSITISGFNHQGPASKQALDVDLLPGQHERIVQQIRRARSKVNRRLPIRTVSLLNQFDGPCACPITNILGIDAHGLAWNCLLAPAPDSAKVDVRKGLAEAWRNLNRQYCCSQTVWSPSLREVRDDGASAHRGG